MEKSHLKIMVITSQLPPMIGGTSIYSAGISQGLQALGHEVTVVIRDKDPARFQGLGLEVLSVPTKGWLKFFTLRKTHHKISEIIKEKKIQVVLFAYPVTGMGKIYSHLEKKKIPYAVSIHSYKKEDLETPRARKSLQEKWGLGGAGKLFACTKWLSEKMEGLSEKPVHTVHLGVNQEIEQKATGEKVEELKKRYQLQDKKVLLCLGRFNPIKNFGAVIRLLPDLKKTFPNIRLMMVGEGPEEKSWKAMARDLGVEEEIIWIPKVPFQEVGLYYKASHVFITVSMARTEENVEESFGLVYVEANLCGVPVIAGKVGGVSEAVEDGKSGILVPPGDLEALKKALFTLLQNEDLRKKMGNYGRERVLSHFTWERAARETASILGEIALEN